ncbi:MAG: tetratricopeptide repeat protein, partial [Bacteroidales bacterium]|nr:tetratricopeptide repeat protein [Bacteroidales bacterium]
LIILTILFLWSCTGMSQKSVKDYETEYYSLEMSGIICGYFETSKTLMNENEKEWLQVKDEVVMKLTVLGEGVDINIQNEYKVDPETEEYFYCNRNYNNGAVELISTTEVKDGKAYFTSNQEIETKEFDLSDGVLLESTYEVNHLIKDFIIGNEKEKTYKVFDNFRGQIVEKSYTFIQEEEVVLNGTSYSTVLLKEIDHSIGTQINYWIDVATHDVVKFTYSGRTITKSDASVKKKIQTADFDDVIFAKVDKVIPNVPEITYMKVEAKIKSDGTWITEESLNFPGQKFTGTVADNLADGIFEIESIRYDGSNAPAFPYDYTIADSLHKYLEPESLIESNHPDIIQEAQEITREAKDSWEATISLSKWVSDNIQGAIPGGTSAIGTYKTRLGECGSHSRLLAAFCRAVGIPARLSIGCMYTTYYQGSFGQHAWTEIFMGDAGWIAVDATAEEIDYVDAGHIRLGELNSFLPVEMNILEYKIGGQEMSEVDNSVPDKYKDLIGKYSIIEYNRIFEVLYSEGSLAVDIPDKVVLALHDADENGLYYPTATRQANFRFDRDDEGNVEAMWLQQTMPVSKKAEQDPIPENTPDDLKPFLGEYSFVAANIEIRVSNNDGELFMSDPYTSTDTKLELNEENGKWELAVSNNEISFEKEDNGNVNQLTYYQNIYLTRGILVSNYVEETIEESGVEEGIDKYFELKNAHNPDCIFNELALNNLGYKLLSSEKNAEALEIFKVNAEEYPDSWNVYDSLGEAYMKNGDKKQAIKSYKKSIKLNPENSDGEEMLAKQKSE